MTVFHKDNIKQIVEMTSLQQGILFHVLTEPQDYYKVQVRIELTGTVDRGALFKSVEFLNKKYDIFRAIFLHEKLERPRQVILKERATPFTYYDLSDQSPIGDVLDLELSKIDNLSTDPLFRVALFEHEEQHTLVLTYHHILMDGWSLSIVVNQLLSTYHAVSLNMEVHLSETSSMEEYVSWLQGLDPLDSKNYWEEELRGYEPVQFISGSSDDTNPKLFREFAVKLGLSTTRFLENYARTQKVSLSSLIQTVWGILLQKYTGSTDVVFGVVTSNRPTEVESIEEMVGLFINTVPLRISATPRMEVGELLWKVYRTMVETMAHVNYPLSQIQSEHDNRLFDHVLIFENYPSKLNQIKTSGLNIKQIHVKEQTNYDINIFVFPESEEITFNFLYNSNVVSEEFIGRLAKYLTQLLSQLQVPETILISDLEIVSDEERETILRFNEEEQTYDQSKLVYQLIEEQAVRNP
ncbi:condensation domain-containing protein, partial [Paenibacillus glucanolyticus]